MGRRITVASVATRVAGAALIGTILGGSPAQAQSMGSSSLGGVSGVGRAPSALSTGMSSSIPSGFSAGTGNFRPNNSTFGQPLGLSAVAPGNGTNPFQQSRTDPQAMGRAGGRTSPTTGNRNGSASRGQGTNASGRGQGRNGQQPFGMNSSAGAVQRVPTMMRVAFTPTPAPAASVIQSAERSIGRSFPSLPGAAGASGTPGVSISFESGVATLRGQVASDSDRTLAATLLSLEPGVREVRNELSVRQ